jgi:hypothetical protein
MRSAITPFFVALVHATMPHAEVAIPSTPTLDPAFVAGMKYELDGRATMRAVSQRLAARMTGEPMAQFWAAYHRLEEFSQPRYRQVIDDLGLPTPNPNWVRFKAALIALIPRFLMTPVLKILHKRTGAYVGKLRHLGTIGPAQHQSFYAYMVAQESLQIELQAAALAEDYPGAARLVDAFISRESAAETMQ